MSSNPTILIKKLDSAKDLPLPEYATANSAGIDLMADVTEEVVIKPWGRALVKTGISIALPEGFEAQVRPRSGLALKNGISVLNTPGTIDADYRGEVCVILVNFGDQDFVISRGMRIAQMIITSVSKARFMQVDELPSTERGEGGFGSTGIKAPQAEKAEA